MPIVKISSGTKASGAFVHQDKGGELIAFAKTRGKYSLLRKWDRFRLTYLERKGHREETLATPLAFREGRVTFASLLCSLKIKLRG